MDTSSSQYREAINASRDYHYLNGRQASWAGNYVNRHLYDLLADHWEGCPCEREGYHEMDNHSWLVSWPENRKTEKRDHPERGPEYPTACPLEKGNPPKTIEQEQEERADRWAARVDAPAPDHYPRGYGYPTNRITVQFRLVD